MKWIVFMVFTSAIFSSFAEWDKAQPVYRIVSDEFSGDVSANYVKIKGVVYNANSIPIINAHIYSRDESVVAHTDSLGRYELVMPITHQSIFLFAKGYNEVLVEGYAFESRHTVTINFFPILNIPVIYDEATPIVTYKPVIYLYAEKPLSASLDLNYLGLLTFTYPQYKNGWKMDVDQNGMREAGTHKTYPYLFWEGEIAELNYLKDDNVLIGTYLKTDSVVSFLENQLTLLGLNRTEQTDFITFWAPRMQSRTYVFVQFLVDDQYAAKVAELNVSPKPDAMRRVYMLFSGFETEQYINSFPQQFENFDRKGFTVLEWGGSEINLNQPG